MRTKSRIFWGRKKIWLFFFFFFNLGLYRVVWSRRLFLELHSLFFLAYTRPFVLGVITDENDGDPITNEKGNRGFNLLYSQLPCANLGWTINIFLSFSKDLFSSPSSPEIPILGTRHHRHHHSIIRWCSVDIVVVAML